jgi:Raf kinase inhibitor-like YbhB/YbcL family protein
MLKKISFFSLAVMSIVACVYVFLCLHGEKNSERSSMKKTLTVTSRSFKQAERLSQNYTCDGANISPHIAWSAVPAETKTVAVICDDPDAPAGTWIHWVIYNLQPTKKELPEAVSASKIAALGGLLGKNSFGAIGFGGACPPVGHGVHHYFFKVYALDMLLPLAQGATSVQVEAAMQGHILAQGELMGTYSRS